MGMLPASRDIRVSSVIFILVGKVFERRENGMRMLLIFLIEAQSEGAGYLKLEETATLLYKTLDSSMLSDLSRIVPWQKSSPCKPYEEDSSPPDPHLKAHRDAFFERRVPSKRQQSSCLSEKTSPVRALTSHVGQFCLSITA